VSIDVDPRNAADFAQRFAPGSRCSTTARTGSRARSTCRALPYTLVLDREGRMVWSGGGGDSADAGEDRERRGARRRLARARRRRHGGHDAMNRGLLDLRLAARLLALAVGGCATVPVKPWQRERLVDPIVAFKAEAREDARKMKTFEAREGSTGGVGGAGGGCACK
jgi:hypothetical protein